jgi:imidazolonepropionase-like amidohydrolase
VRAVSRREFLVLAAAGLLAGCRPTPPAAHVLALVNGTLIDGTGADAVPDVALIVQDGRIVAVGPRARVEVPVHAQRVDVQGATMLPGFINAHVHAAYDESSLKAWAQGGVTTVRDLGNGTNRAELFALRDEALRNPQCARLVAAGPMVTVPGGYPIVPWGEDGLTVTSPDDARQQVARLLEDGADVIKIALESGAIFRRKIPTLSPEEAAAIVEETHRRGTRVSVHVTISPDLERALDAGVDDVAHMVVDELPQDLIERMVEAGVYWEPTLELWHGVSSVNPVDYDRQAIGNLRRFVEAGGQVALGTDYAGYSTEFQLGMPTQEIGWMQEAGMTPMHVIVSGTRHAAHVCNLERELGTLEVGKLADVLVVDGDPLEELQALANVRLVLRGGEIIRGAAPA